MNQGKDKLTINQEREVEILENVHMRHSQVDTNLPFKGKELRLHLKVGTVVESLMNLKEVRSLTMREGGEGGEEEVVETEGGGEAEAEITGTLMMTTDLHQYLH